MYLSPPKNRTSKVPRTPSPNKLGTSRYSTVSRKQNQRSPNHLYTTKFFEEEMQSLQKQKAFIDECLKIYESLLQTKTPQRCLSHNNSISLYCYKEKRLLCVNCLFSSNHHKNHRVVPLKQALKDIQKDNLNRFGEVATSINWIQSNQQISKQNVQMLTKSVQNITKILQKDFDMFMRDMSNKYLQLKSSVLEEYRRATAENEQFYNQTKLIKMVVDQSLEKIDSYKGGQDFQVVRHLFVENITHSLKNIFKKPLERVNTQMFESLAKSQLNKLKIHLQKHRWTKIVPY